MCFSSVSWLRLNHNQSVMPGKPSGTQGPLLGGKSHHCVPRAEPPCGKGGANLGVGLMEALGINSPHSPCSPMQETAQRATGGLSLVKKKKKSTHQYAVVLEMSPIAFITETL